MDWLIDIVYSNTLWLYSVIYSNKLFFIDFWTFNHIWSGAFLFVVLTALKIKRVWLYLIMLLFTYEIIEILFRIFKLNLFKPEIIKDQINDIIFGIVGAFLCFYLMKFRKGKSFSIIPIKYPLTAFLTAGTFSYLYVGFTNFRTDLLFENTVSFKITFFAIYWVIFFCIIQIYEVFQIRIFGEIKSSTLLSFIFIPLLIIIVLITQTLFIHNIQTIISFDKLIVIYFNENIFHILFFLLIPTLLVLLYKNFKILINKAMEYV